MGRPSSSGPSSRRETLLASLRRRPGTGHRSSSRAAGQGRITLDELDTRIDATYNAKTYAELEVITRDLPATQSATMAASGSDAYPVERIGGTPKRSLSLAILSGARRKGTWVVPPAYTAVAFLGGVEMDLRDARFSQRDVKIRAFAFLGGVDIVVPEDIEVDVSGIGIMGGFDHKESSVGAPERPSLACDRPRVHGWRERKAQVQEETPRSG